MVFKAEHSQMIEMQILIGQWKVVQRRRRRRWPWGYLARGPVLTHTIYLCQNAYPLFQSPTCQVGILNSQKSEQTVRRGLASKSGAESQVRETEAGTREDQSHSLCGSLCETSVNPTIRPNQSSY